MKKILLLALIMLWLPACVPVAFLAGATAGGAVVYDHRGIEAIYHDTETSHQIKLAIDDDSAFKHSRIVVASFNGIILLTGKVSNAYLIEKAKAYARENKATRQVYSEITIGKPLSPLASSQDAWITAKVKANMLAENGLKAAQIKVITENKTVYLMGIVGRAQAKQAAETASQISGVKRVVKLFQYL